jgi:hypothetical protein
MQRIDDASADDLLTVYNREWLAYEQGTSGLNNLFT